MSKDIWVLSDTHFNHTNILGFTDQSGEKIRGSRFSSVEEMDEEMVQKWNSVVKEGDKVYHLGDVYFGSQQRADEILSRLNGKKRLIVGNHDCIYGKGNVLQKHFQKIYLWRVFKEFGLLLSHVPVHPDSIKGGGINVHGHIHERKVLITDGCEGCSPNTRVDERYRCVSVEHTNYTPVNIEELRVK